MFIFFAVLDDEDSVDGTEVSAWAAVPLPEKLSNRGISLKDAQESNFTNY